MEEYKTLIPAKMAFEFNVLPVKIEEDSFKIGIPDVNNLKLIDEISFYTGYKISPVEMSSDIILFKLKELYPEYILDVVAKQNISDDQIFEYSNIELVNQIINDAINQNASDIHFEVFENTFRIRFRIDGHLREVYNIPLSKTSSVISRLKIMADLDISEKRRPQDGKIKYKFQNRSIDIRVSLLPTSFGEKVVLRILDKSQLKLDLNKLGLSLSQSRLLIEKLKNPYGMILVTGPTGSGKTTTLYAALQHIHSIEKNILTIEDPIEYNLEGINQSKVRPEIGYDFANALRTFLRQDPDVIMVGEIRDKETAEIAIRASLTGHLVFSTLHTNDSISAFIRLIDMGIEPYLVASSVKLIVAQRLIRMLCKCKKASLKPFDFQGRVFAENSYVANGCAECGNTGYKKRTALFELIEVNEELADLISCRAPILEIKNKAKEFGFISLRESGLEKIGLGLTTYDEVFRETTA